MTDFLKNDYVTCEEISKVTEKLSTSVYHILKNDLNDMNLFLKYYVLSLNMQTNE